jgi:hypothetical protein
MIMGTPIGRAAALAGAMASLLIADEAFANPIALSQAKALQGGVTPGDGPGFPITLSEHGSYIFESDIRPTSGVNGIEVTSPYVTVDLNGFLLHGGGAANTGITTTGNALTVKNGIIGHFKSVGIQAPTAYVSIRNMTIVENGQNGVVLGDYAMVNGSTISANGSSGIDCGNYCHVQGNVLSENKFRGVYIGSGSTLGNTIENNQSFGIRGVGQSGYGNNTLLYNYSGAGQVLGPLIPLQPNACSPACP